jgi:hypothetical protein
MKKVIDRSFCLGLALALVLQVIPSGTARAQGTALSDEQVKERLGFITDALKAGQPRAGTWYYGWTAAYGAGAVVLGFLAGSHWHDTKLEGTETVADREFAEGMLVGGATFALGVGGMLIDPFVPARAPRKLAALPEGSPVERAAKLKRAEDLLRECAARERRGRSLTTHLLNLGANAAGAVVTKFGFNQSWGSALVSFALGEGVSLLNIFTQPTRATHDLASYEAKYLAGKGGVALPQAERRWTLSAGPRSLTFRYEF